MTSEKLTWRRWVIQLTKMNRLKVHILEDRAEKFINMNN